MNSLERVMGRLAGTPVDRVPWFGLLSLYGAKYTGASIERHFRDPLLFAAGVDAVVERLGPDILAIPFSVALQAEACGMPIRFPANGPPNLVIPDEAMAAGWRQREEPDPDKSAPLRYLRESLALVLERHGTTRTVIAGLTGPLELAVALVGAEGLMERLLFRQEEALALLEKTAAMFVRWTNRLFADGLHVGVFVGAFSNAEVLTPQLARFVRPIVAEALSQVNGPIVFHHGGGKLMPLLDIWKELPHVVGYFMDARDDLPDARILVGPDPLLFGNLNGPALTTPSAHTVQQQAQKILLRMRDDSRFILGTSGADIPLDTPEANILAIPKAILDMSGRAGPERS